MLGRRSRRRTGLGPAPVTAAATPRSDDRERTLVELLNGFVHELRTAGIPVSLTENLDAMEAVRHIPLVDRQAFKYALATTMVKNESHWRAFETVFEVYFSLRGSEFNVGAGNADDVLDQLLNDAQQQDSGQGLDGLTPEELAEMLFQAMMQQDQMMTQALARQAVRRYAGMEPGRPVGGTYYLYRTLRNLDLDALLERMMQRADEDHRRDHDGEPLAGLGERLQREEFETRVEELKREIEAEIRRRLVADRGAEAMAKTLRKPLPEDVDFMHASREEMAGIRKAIQPLTRKLAAKLARKRRHRRRGPLDFRRTVRASLSFGGVPAEPKYRFPRPSKPEIVVLADISGSVAAFARFTLHLVYAISNHFSKVRAFVFIDGLDEVTRFFDSEEDIGEAIRRINTEADVIWVDGHSDYGHAFQVFWEQHQRAVTSKTTLLVLGDARNNYHAANAWVLKKAAEKARNVYWLNPEPRSYWDTGDSIIGEYGNHCEEVFEVRNLRQLETFVERLE